jgi:hypothetical protein
MAKIKHFDYPFGIFNLFYQCGMLYFGHCVVCPSLIYSFRLPIWYLQTLLSMWHALFWPLCSLSFDLQLQIIHLALIEEFEDTKLVIWSCKSKKDRQHNGQNKACHIDIKVWKYQMGNRHVLFWPLCFLSFFDLQLQITHLVSSNSSINVACFILAIVLSVLLWFTASDYPFGIFQLFYTMAKIKHATLIEEFDDTKWVTWSCKSKKDRQHNA